MKRSENKSSEDSAKETKVMLFNITVFVFFGYVLFNLIAMLIDSKSAVLYRINLNQCNTLLLMVFMILVLVRAIKIHNQK